MANYVVSRLFGMVVVMALVVTVVFFIVRVAPGDPASMMLGPEANSIEVAQLRRRLGLDEPLLLQYMIFLGQVACGNLGDSLFLGRPVLTALGERVEPTLLLTLLALAISCSIALPLGIVAAYRRASLLDRFATGMAMLAASLPSFWLALILTQVFAVRLGLLPVSGYGAPQASLAQRLSYLILPAAALGIVSSAPILRFTRASMIEVLGEDYIRTARAKGIKEAGVVVRHALRNALIPIITVVGLITTSLLSGAVVVETVFGVPGVGSLVFQAVLRRDYPIIQGALLVVAMLYVLLNLAVDLLYVVVDRRVRF